MTAKEFKSIWAGIQGKPLNIAYGKQVFRNVVLINYNEAAASVETSMKGVLNTRAIKEVFVIEEKKPEVIEPEVEFVYVSPTLPDNWKAKGYFIITGKFGANWKRAEYRDTTGEVVLERKGNTVVEMVSETSFRTIDCLHWVYEVKNRLKGLAPDFLVDDTYAAPQYFDISSSVIKQIK